MAITFHPRAGQILFCDFSEGFREPEMVKSKRPVVVLTPPMSGRPNLVTIVPLSTTVPDPVMPYHYELPAASLPQIGRLQRGGVWLKGDMIYTVGFHRLDQIRLGKPDRATGKRQYYQNRLGRAQMTEIYKCVMNGLNLSHLGQYI